MLGALSPLASTKKHLGHFFENRSRWEQQLREINEGLSSLQINWQECAGELVSSLDTRKRNEPDGNFSDLEKRIQEFIEKVGLQLIAPQPGNRYNPRLHVIQSTQSFPDIARGRIGEVIIRGLRNEARVIQKAQVVISKGN